MDRMRQVKDFVHWYMGELTARVVAESGIPSDRFHLGKIILQSLKDAPDFILQIDGAADESETCASVLERSVRCAICLQNLGLHKGDVMVLMAMNHLDVAIPFYAALYLGITIAPVDKTLNVKELQETYSIHRPKIIFCQSEKAPDVQLALNEIDLNAQIITFDKGDYLFSFPEFLEKFGGDTDVAEFKPADIDPEETVSILVATSGTTGVPKAAATTHKNFAVAGPYWWSRFTKFPTPTRMVLLGSPLQWLTGIYHFIMSPIMRYTRLQSSEPLVPKLAYRLINKYRPSYTFLSPTMMMTFSKPGERDKCDFTCFEMIYLGGSAVPATLVAELKIIAPNAEVVNGYGMTEVSGIAFHGDNPPPDSCGKPLGCFQYRLVDPFTKEDVTEPNARGELWIKGPGVFQGYYKNPEATEECFAEDRWFKTGDILYRDENFNFFFVERYKLLLKYAGHHVSPVELENVIRGHPGVSDVAVIGIPDSECNDLAVACVVRNPGHDVTADEIKELVKENLSDTKQLRGGVVFLDQIPMTASTKIHRRKLKEIVMEMEKE